MKGLVKQLSLELRIRKDGGGEHGGIGHKEGVEVVRIRQTSTSIERMTLDQHETVRSTSCCIKHTGKIKKAGRQCSNV